MAYIQRHTTLNIFFFSFYLPHHVLSISTRPNHIYVNNGYTPNFAPLISDLLFTKEKPVVQFRPVSEIDPYMSIGLFIIRSIELFLLCKTTSSTNISTYLATVGRRRRSKLLLKTPLPPPGEILLF